MRATVVCDASYDDRKQVGGWAAWVRVDGYPLPIKGFGTIRNKPRNSTEAEVMAALNGIYIAANRGATEILVRSDCMTVQQLIHKQGVKDYLQEVWDGALAAGWARGIRHLASRHVKGHGDRNRHAAAFTNDWCDQRAKTAMRAARRGKKNMLHIGEDVK
jgi:ribonuclease HI